MAKNKPPTTPLVALDPESIRWKYQVRDLPDDTSAKRLEEVLNILGKEGYEPVPAPWPIDSRKLLFRRLRRKEDDKP